MTIHYNDGLIDVREIGHPFNLVTFTNVAGDTKVVFYDNNLFEYEDLVTAYESLWRSDWNMDDGKPEYVAKFKEFLTEEGAKFDK